MDALTITLMLAAAVLHASWHSLVKSGSHGLAVLTGMCLISALAAGCVLPFVPPPPRSVWPILLLSIVLHSGYRLCLAQAYKHGDLSQAYPMARGMVPLIAAAFAVPLLGQVPTAGELLGIVIISAGLLALASESFSRRISRAASRRCGVGRRRRCVVFRDRRLRNSRVGRLDLVHGLADRPRQRNFFRGGLPCRRSANAAGAARSMGRTLVSAILGLGSFCVFLWALSRSPVGAVSALRETSILFATLIGMVFHGDRRSPLRIVAALTITARNSRDLGRVVRRGVEQA